jgi:hypothetical protein
MRNGNIIPPHDFEHPSDCHYRVSEVKKYLFGVVTHGITTIPNLIKILADIIQLLNAHRRMSQVKFELG